MPPAACDTHVHVFDPARFAYVADRAYTPGPARCADLVEMLDALGTARVVLVQPSVYGHDNACLVDALRSLGSDRARGIAVVDLATVERTELERLHDAGVRGVRLNLKVQGEGDSSAALVALDRAQRLAELPGWSLQLHASLAVLGRLAERIDRLPLPVVLDHFAGARAAAGEAQPGWVEVEALLRRPHVHVKLSAPYRVSDAAPGHADVAWLAKRFFEISPDRVLWGSDWPHTGGSGTREGRADAVEAFRGEDAGRALDALRGCAPDAFAWRRLLVDNPARLYGFAATPGAFGAAAP